MNRILVLLAMLVVGNVYALPPCPPNVFHNCFGTKADTNGSKYVGDYKDGKYHGQGTFTTASGWEYVGEFKDGKTDGQGVLNYPSGRIFYSGEWVEGVEKDRKPMRGINLGDRPKLDWSGYQPFDETIQKQINCFFEHPEWIEVVRKFDTITAGGPEFITLHDKFYIEAVDKRNILREMASVDISNMFNDPPFRPLDIVEAFSLILERGMPSLSREQVEFAASEVAFSVGEAELDLERLDRTSTTEFASQEEKQVLRRLACLNDQKRKQVIDSGFMACLGAEGNFWERFGKYSNPAMDSLNMLLIDGRITFGKYSQERLSFFDQIMTLSASNEASGLAEFESNLKDYFVKRGLLNSKGEPLAKTTFSCADD